METENTVSIGLARADSFIYGHCSGCGLIDDGGWWVAYVKKGYENLVIGRPSECCPGHIIVIPFVSRADATHFAKENYVSVDLAKSTDHLKLVTFSVAGRTFEYGISLNTSIH